MDLMTLSGFCRNCLAKWMVVEARALVDSPKEQDIFLDDMTKKALNALGYEEAAEHVYGTTYGEWKKRHQKKATEAQMQKFNNSSHIHAKHDKTLLATRAPHPEMAVTTDTARKPTDTVISHDKPAGTTSILSNVCCQTVDGEKEARNELSTLAVTTVTAATSSNVPPVASKSRTLPPYQPAPLPTYTVQQELIVAILTVSDRASKGEYETGDLSGPAVEQALRNVTSSNDLLHLGILETVIVPDDADAIVAQLERWCNQSNQSRQRPDLILTTGGTGMSPRDVTPEATKRVLHTECVGLMPFVLSECAKIQPLATLSRGTVGIIRNCTQVNNSHHLFTIVANLPGNPKGVHEIMPLLLPLLLHAKTHM